MQRNNVIYFPQLQGTAPFTLSAYPTWILVLSWVLGAILLIAGVLWHLFVGSISNPRKLELLQRDFREYLGRNWDGRGKVLDIGTGSGRAAIEIAKHFPEAHVMGTDLWSKGWRFFGMSKAQAETNARIENMSDRCGTQKSQGSRCEIGRRVPFQENCLCFWQEGWEPRGIWQTVKCRFSHPNRTESKKLYVSKEASNYFYSQSIDDYITEWVNLRARATSF